jgi:hypothetical protein
MGKWFYVWMGLVMSCWVAQAQLTTDADFKRTVYTDDYSIGIMLHSKGYGANFRRLYYMDGFNKQGWEIDLVNIRHEKEVNIYNPFDNSARGFVFGKINSFYSLRSGYVRDFILVDKTDQGTVALDLILSGGLSLGLVKPVYLEIYEAVGNGSFILVTERYDPDIHNFIDIYGRASFFTGFNEIQFHPGVYLKAGVSFDFNLFDDRLTTLETGVVADYFPEEVPIMYTGSGSDGLENHNLFVQLYLTVNFGKKWN